MPINLSQIDMETIQPKTQKGFQIWGIEVSILLIGLGFLVRILAMLVSGQLETENYWEYGQIAHNIIEGKGYSFNFTDQNLVFTNETYPSALMPPGYVFFLLPILMIKDLIIRNLLLFSIQTGIQIAAIWLSFLMIQQKLNKMVAILTLVLLCFLPDLVFACCSVGPTVWFQFLLVIILFWFRKTEKNNWFLLGILAGILILMRSESILIVLAFGVFSLKKSGLKFTLLVASVVCITLLPWVLRNWNTLGILSISNSAGVNFYRGNNPGEIGDWPQGFDKTYDLLKSNPESFEVKYDQYAFQRSITYIKSNPTRWLLILPQKLFRFVVLDWPDKRTHQFLYWFPWLICLGFGFWGIKINGNLFREELSILLLFTLLMLVFFPQVRYQTMAKFFFLPFTGIGLASLLKQIGCFGDMKISKNKL